MTPGQNLESCAMTKIKICGITRIDDALYCAGLGTDYLGFVFAPGPRNVSPEKAAEIIGELGGMNVLAAGVFVNEEEEEVKRTADLCGLDVLQFHGEETPEFCGRFPEFSVFKAFRIKCESDLARLKEYRTDAHLIDAFVEGLRGGTGKLLPAEIAAKAAEFTGRLFLSGGLDPENVAGRVESVKPFGVDVSSGVERSPGVKDREKLKRFINAVRNV